ncbi:Pre-mRNA-splicing factor Isy1 [Trinorchestia longiramus]|nr:Pre-mRNA-splicing factor Isy1 [Trinorchestia longiramus]
MARNAEKAMTTLARWRAAQEGGSQPTQTRRPYLASDCSDLRQADRWRNQVISEVARKVAQIQNAGLGEFRIRDLNDEINKLLREKGHWEVRIRELGGPDYSVSGPKLFGSDGQEIPGNRGYMYFGAAKELPGVRELFEQEPAAPPRRTRADLMKHIDADYYGYRDDDDGVLAPLEQEVEQQAVRQLILNYRRKKFKQSKQANGSDDGDDEAPKDDDNDAGEEDSEDIDEFSIDEEDERAAVLRYMAHVPNIPSQQEMEEALLERKKKDLLHRLLGDSSD